MSFIQPHFGDISMSKGTWNIALKKQWHAGQWNKKAQGLGMHFFSSSFTWAPLFVEQHVMCKTLQKKQDSKSV